MERNYEIVIAKCPECSKIKKLSFFKNENTRFTFCITCGEVVLWKKLEQK